LLNGRKIPRRKKGGHWVIPVRPKVKKHRKTKKLDENGRKKFKLTGPKKGKKKVALKIEKQVMSS